MKILIDNVTISNEHNDDDDFVKIEIGNKSTVVNRNECIEALKTFGRLDDGECPF